jgi:P27 family predicted phage terminase small subunit
MGGKGSGRIPRPAGLKLVEGRSEGRDSDGRKVPLPPRFRREAPEPPAGLDDVALAEWRRVVPHLEAHDLLSPAHQAILGCYCHAVSDHTAAMATVHAEGRLITNPKTGHQHPHPAVADARASRAQVLQLGRELGLTPSAEQRFASVDDGDPDSYNPFAESPPWKRIGDGDE